MLEMDGIDDLILTASEIRKLEALCTIVEHLYSVTKALQSDNISFAEARAFFDTVIEEYLETRESFAQVSSYCSSAVL